MEKSLKSGENACTDSSRISGTADGTIKIPEILRVEKRISGVF